MNTQPLPSVFISHGSPMIALEPGAAGAFLKTLGPAIDKTFGRPRAVVVASAHTTAREPVVLAGPQHEAIHDFDPRLNEMRYDAPGSPEVAAEVAGLLKNAKLPVHVINEGGLDHGIWTALRYIYPDADIAIVPVAFVPTHGPAQQFALGQALAPLRLENVLVLGTGSITHNLRRVFAGGSQSQSNVPEIAESAQFREWMREKGAAGDWAALADYRRLAPHAADMHPTDEHLLPWFVAAGAGGMQSPAIRLHDSVTHGVLGMDAYAFGTEAPTLEHALH
jgi:4,5-DOPA dioxygenase extradiol